MLGTISPRRRFEKVSNRSLLLQVAIKGIHLMIHLKTKRILKIFFISLDNLALCNYKTPPPKRGHSFTTPALINYTGVFCMFLPLIILNNEISLLNTVHLSLLTFTTHQPAIFVSFDYLVFINIQFYFYVSINFLFKSYNSFLLLFSILVLLLNKISLVN